MMHDKDHAAYSEEMVALRHLLKSRDQEIADLKEKLMNAMLSSDASASTCKAHQERIIALERELDTQNALVQTLFADCEVRMQ